MNQPPNTFTDPNPITWPWRDSSVNRWSFSWSLMYFAALSFYINTGCYGQQSVSGLISNLLKLKFAARRGGGRAGLGWAELGWAGSGWAEGYRGGNLSGRGESGCTLRCVWTGSRAAMIQVPPDFHEDLPPQSWQLMTGRTPFIIRPQKEHDHVWLDGRCLFKTYNTTWQHGGRVHKDCIAEWTQL